MVDKWAGSIEIGVTTHNPAYLQLPSTMTNLRSGGSLPSPGGPQRPHGVTTHHPIYPQLPTSIPSQCSGGFPTSPWGPYGVRNVPMGSPPTPPPTSTCPPTVTHLHSAGFLMSLRGSKHLSGVPTRPPATPGCPQVVPSHLNMSPRHLEPLQDIFSHSGVFLGHLEPLQGVPRTS